MLTMSVAAIAETHTVQVNSDSFAPAVLEVAPGDTVIWQYTSGWMGHTVTSGMNCIADRMFFDASVNNGTPTFEWVVPDYASVDIPYFCKPHCGMGMTGVISINADGATLQVPGDYLTIAEAIDAAVAGDIINIAAGTYYEADLAIGAANITLRGEANADGTPAVTIDAQQQGRVFEMVDVTHPPPGIPGLVVFDTMVITGGSVSGNGGGVSITTCSPVFRNCTITQNSCTGNGGGVYIYHQAEGAPWARADVKFIGCTIIGNDAQDGGGMFSKSNEYNDGAQPSLFGCVVNENTASNGVGGIRHATWLGQTTVVNSIICGNVPVQISGTVELYEDSCAFGNCLDEDADGVPDGCRDADGILHVPSEYPTLETAWEELSHGDTIAIAAGTYAMGDLDEEALVTEEMAVSIIGETNADGTPATILDGEGSEFEGIYIQGTDSQEHPMMIENVHFRHFPSEGGGVALTYGTGHIRNCIFEGTYDSCTSLRMGNFQGTLEDCLIIDSTSYYLGGLSFVDWEGHPASDITVTNCLIDNNYGSFPWGGGNGGVHFFLGSNSDGDNSIGGTVHFVDCTITGNEGDNGGIDLSPQWNVTLTNTTVCGNETPGQIYGGTWTDGGGNCIQDHCDNCADCPADLDGNGEVSVDDLLALLAAFQINDDGDCDNDGDTDINDLLAILAAWGPCP